MNKLSAPIQQAPECISCDTCTYATFNGPIIPSLKRHQMLINGPRLPGGDVNSLVNTKDLNKLVFSVLVSAATPDEMVLNLQNLRSQDGNAAPNSFNQRSIYRINLFNEKGQSQSTYLHLDGYAQCTYRLKHPYNVFGSFVPQVVVLNHIV